MFALLRSFRLTTMNPLGAVVAGVLWSARPVIIVDGLIIASAVSQRLAGLSARIVGIR